MIDKDDYKIRCDDWTLPDMSGTWETPNVRELIITWEIEPITWVDRIESENWGLNND